MNTETTKTKRTRTLAGVVVSDKMQDTVVVAVTRFVKHPKYLKYQKIVKRYHAHDAGNTKSVGDKVVMRECRPLSKKKHFIIVPDTATDGTK
jgi:small subunit ribosomal protein S17